MPALNIDAMLNPLPIDIVVVNKALGKSPVVARGIAEAGLSLGDRYGVAIAIIGRIVIKMRAR